MSTPAPGGTWVCGCPTERHAQALDADRCRLAQLKIGRRPPSPERQHFLATVQAMLCAADPILPTDVAVIMSEAWDLPDPPSTENPSIAASRWLIWRTQEFGTRSVLPPEWLPEARASEPMPDCGLCGHPFVEHHYGHGPCVHGDSCVCPRYERPASGITLPGWTCGACKIFNGSGKKLLAWCRNCGAPRGSPF